MDQEDKDLHHIATRPHIHTCIHTYIHTYIHRVHTYTYTYTQSYICLPHHPISPIPVTSVWTCSLSSTEESLQHSEGPQGLQTTEVYVSGVTSTFRGPSGATDNRGVCIRSHFNIQRALRGYRQQRCMYQESLQHSEGPQGLQTTDR